MNTMTDIIEFQMTVTKQVQLTTADKIALKAMLNNGRERDLKLKIWAIKYIKERFGLSLLESKIIVDILRDNLHKLDI